MDSMIYIVISFILSILSFFYYSSKRIQNDYNCGGYSLKYHRFFKYFMLPYSILSHLLIIIDRVNAERYVGCAYHIGLAIANYFIFKNLKTRNKKFYILVIIFMISFYSLNCIIETYNSSEYPLISFISSGTWVIYSVCTYIYYKKRPLLFENTETTNDSIKTHIINENIFETNNEHKNHEREILFCRKCGNKLPKDTIFCPYCGNKLEKGNK